MCLRDGEKCYLCGDPPTHLYSLDIEHVDGNQKNRSESNLRLACRKCNVAKENRHRAARPRGVSACARASTNQGIEVSRDEMTPSTRVYKEAIPYHQGSPEMQANAVYEVRYRRWILEYVKATGFIPKKEAINAGAEVVGCNPSSAARYLCKLTSMVGPLIEGKDATGQEIVWLKVIPKETQLPLSNVPKEQLPLGEGEHGDQGQ